MSHSLAEDDPLRFDLVQWHKSFGIAVLLLVVLRVLWRLMHRPPALPAHMGGLERFAAHMGHFGLYCLMLALPLTGWAMVSASPLNLATELFGVIPWPHLPWLETIADRDVWEYRFSTAHHWLGNAIIALVLVHAAAALRHHFWLRDGLLARMAIARGDQHAGLVPGMVILVAGLLGLGGLMERQGLNADPFAVSLSETGSTSVGASSSANTSATETVNRIGFSASQMGDPINGVFADHEISLVLDPAQPEQGRLTATVNTSSVSTGDGQIDATVVTADWFASDEFPQARFESSQMLITPDGGYEVTGVLTIRDVPVEVSFAMQVDANTYRGEVLIDRRDFGVGTGGQDDFVAPEVSISFSFTP